MNSALRSHSALLRIIVTLNTTMSDRSQCGGIQKQGDVHVPQDHIRACRSDTRGHCGDPNHGLGTLARRLA
jgi:hypothetical protein